MLPDSLWAAIFSTGENSEFYRGATGVHRLRPENLSSPCLQKGRNIFQVELFFQQTNFHNKLKYVEEIVLLFKVL